MYHFADDKQSKTVTMHFSNRIRGKFLLEDITVDEFLKERENFGHLFDVRSPAEFEHSHIPAADNFYVFTNEERARVGTIYKQVSSFEAKVLGAGLICKNMSRHLEELYPRVSPKEKIAIYCARGGMRSGAASTILSSIGYRIYRLTGGYKSYRAHVTSGLNSFPHKNFFVLHGPTGSAKTQIVKSLSCGIDIEGLARHLGSSFGAIMGAQPTQKMFQNQLYDALSRFDAGDKIVLEGESVKLGNIILPTLLHERMQEGCSIYLDMPFEFRVEEILRQYSPISSEFFDRAMEKIKPYMKGSSWLAAKEAFVKNDLKSTAETLLAEYYDKVYKKPKNIDLMLRPKSIDEAIREVEAFLNSYQT